MYWISIAVSLDSLGFAAYSLFKLSTSVAQEQLQKVQDEVEGLRLYLKKENDDLKDRLYKAEKLIVVYESDSVS